MLVSMIWGGSCFFWKHRYEQRHKISNNVVFATSKASDQSAHTRSLIRAFASRLSVLWLLSHWLNTIGVSKLKRRLQRLVGVYTCQNTTLLEITCTGSNLIIAIICWFGCCEAASVFSENTDIFFWKQCRSRYWQQCRSRYWLLN